MKKVAVLGRGKSLEFLNSLPEVDAYVRECVPGGEQSYFEVEGKSNTISAESLPDEVKPFMWEAGKDNCPKNYTGKKYDLPTTGMAGVLYATAIMNLKERKKEIKLIQKVLWECQNLKEYQ